MTTPVMSSTASIIPATDRYSLVLSTETQHRLAAQRLRYQVFASEPGFALPSDADGLDADRFDEFCDHLLVHDQWTDSFVGCYRMMPPPAAVAAGGYYTATEFDISALDPVGSNIVEMGRAAVHPDHRSGSVLGLMWAGILHYLDVTGYEWVMGCVSVPLRAAPGDRLGANVRGVRDRLLSKHASAPDRRVRPHTPVVIDGLDLVDVEPAARIAMPPLLNGYLRLGASICGEPAHDPEFGVADFVALLGLHEANTRYLDRLRSAATTFESGIR